MIYSIEQYLFVARFDPTLQRFEQPGNLAAVLRHLIQQCLILGVVVRYDDLKRDPTVATGIGLGALGHLKTRPLLVDDVAQLCLQSSQLTQPQETNCKQSGNEEGKTEAEPQTQIRIVGRREEGSHDAHEFRFVMVESAAVPDLRFNVSLANNANKNG